MPFCSSHATEEEENIHAEEENVDLSQIERGGGREGGLRHKQRLGESIVGDRRETSPYEITFMDSVEWRLLCKTTLEKPELTKFKEAIHNNYFFEMFVEDLPMWGYIGDASGEDFIIGEVEGSQTYLFPHLHFRLGYNGKNIVSAKVTTDVSKCVYCGKNGMLRYRASVSLVFFHVAQLDRRVDITNVEVPKTVQFSYSVEWVEEELAWKDRMSLYAESRFLPSSFEIHWLSIINSFVLVLLLTAFLTIILLRVLKNDFSRYMELDDDAMEEEEVSVNYI